MRTCNVHRVQISVAPCKIYSLLGLTVVDIAEFNILITTTTLVQNQVICIVHTAEKWKLYSDTGDLVLHTLQFCVLKVNFFTFTEFNIILLFGVLLPKKEHCPISYLSQHTKFSKFKACDPDQI